MNALTESEEEALLRQLKTRREARRSVLAFARTIDVPGRPVEEDEEGSPFVPAETKLAKHHCLILEAMDRISKTPRGRLILLFPPGAGKSTYASVVSPARFLGEKGGRKIILTSYGDTLATKMGRRTRSVIQQRIYKAIYGTELEKDSKAADNFVLTNGSEYMASGILSGITGNRADGVIIDDPIKGREQANSKLTRDKTFDAYEDDIKTRLLPAGWIVLIQTRWHEDDLAGRILPDGWKGESGKIPCKDGNIWEVLCVSAKCERSEDPLGREIGEYLWPEWFGKEHWQEFEAVPRTWNALFQQRPSALEGDIFKPDKIQVIDAEPQDAVWVRGWDLASTTDGNWTVGLKLGRLRNRQYVIGHVVRLRVGPDERDSAIKNTTSMDGHKVKVSIPQDPGQAGKTQVIYLTGVLAGYRVDSSPESGDKVTRAEPFAAQVNVGNVLMVKGDWNRALIDEFRSFPNGLHDDQVDAASRAFALLMLTSGGPRISDEALMEAGRRPYDRTR